MSLMDHITFDKFQLFSMIYQDSCYSASLIGITTMLTFDASLNSKDYKALYCYML